MVFGYPLGVYFMLSSEFCERFSFYGMRSLLFTYFTQEHTFASSDASVIVHLFLAIAYLCPLIGSILADSLWGRFKVILYGSVVYVLGHAILSGGAIPTLADGLRTTFDFTGLFVIAFATGFIKPCVAAFAADQFNEDQKAMQSQFFSFFYFAINLGSVLSMITTPMVRSKIHCFGKDECYAMAFGVPGILMFLALVCFVAGAKLYKKLPASRTNTMGKMVKCVAIASGRSVTRCREPCNHWLDRASSHYSPEFISSVRSVLNVLLLFAPLILFWALFDQQSTTWVSQATQMDGRVFNLLTILPEQVAVLNPLFVLILVPLLEGVIYPLFRKIVNVTPLRKICVGGFIAAVAFVLAGFVQLAVESSIKDLLPGENNTFIRSIGDSNLIRDFINMDGVKYGPDNSRQEIPLGTYSFMVNGKKQTLNLTESGHGYVVDALVLNNGSDSITSFAHPAKQTTDGSAQVYIMSHDPTAMVYVYDKNNDQTLKTEAKSGNHLKIVPGTFGSVKVSLHFGTTCSGLDCSKTIEFDPKMGGVYVLDTERVRIIELVEPNSINILWTMPQYFTITLGEALLSVTALEFSYTQASADMKSVLQAFWLLTVFAGNTVAMAITGLKLISDPAIEFFFYAGLMVVVMIVFAVLAIFYTYVEDLEESGKSAVETSKSEKDMSEVDLTEKSTSAIEQTDEKSSKSA